MFEQAKIKFATDHNVIAAVAILLAICGLDAALTLWGLTLEMANTANALVDLLYARIPVTFIFVKLPLPLAIWIYIWRRRQRDPLLITLALVISLTLYVTATGFHVYFAILQNIL